MIYRAFFYLISPFLHFLLGKNGSKPGSGPLILSYNNRVWKIKGLLDFGKIKSSLFKLLVIDKLTAPKNLMTGMRNMKLGPPTFFNFYFEVNSPSRRIK